MNFMLRAIHDWQVRMQELRSFQGFRILVSSQQVMKQYTGLELRYIMADSRILQLNHCNKCSLH